MLNSTGDHPEVPGTAQKRTGPSEKTNVDMAIRDLSLNLATAIDERDRIENELKRVKRKYRRAAAEAEAAKAEVALLKQQFSDLQATLEADNRQSPASVFARIVQSRALRRLKTGRSSKVRRVEQLNLIRKSHLFDADWYLATYPDVAAARLDPALHYLADGWVEGRDPGPDFNSSSYLKANRDVAQSGLNPLVHYLEHGLVEGRAAGPGRSTPPRRSIENFGAPAPVYQASVNRISPIRWLRHYQLDVTRPQLWVGGQAAGYSSSAALPDIEVAIDRFWRLSGLPARPGTAAEISDSGSCAGPSMLDGWFAGQSLFRARWDVKDSEPFVVRAYQSGRERLVRLVGEALVTSSLDITDFPAAHPLMPVLFIACEPDGAVIGATTLFFPSLCRGGLHYSELLLGEGDASLSPVGLADSYASALEAILDDRVSALVKSVRVDLRGADGTHPMFQSYCQDWLSTVLRTGIGEAVVSQGDKSPDVIFLTNRVSGHNSGHPAREAASGQLILPSDALPTIAILVAASHRGARAAGQDVHMSMIVTHADPARPALAVRVPQELILPTISSASAFPLGFPRLEGATPTVSRVFAAIRRLAERDLTESELLQPIAQPVTIVTESAQADLVVALEPALWPEGALEAGMAALRLQKGIDSATICIIGTMDPARRAIIERAFPGQAISRLNVHAFIDHLGTGDVLHLGPEVILHDSRTIETLRALLTDASSASCPILTCTRQGKNWTVGVADAGDVLTQDNEASTIALAGHADYLWRNVVPLSGQPANLWIARPNVLREAPEEAKMPHLLCEFLTASYWDRQPEARATIVLPRACADRSICVKVLAG